MQERAVPLCENFDFGGALHADYLCTAADNQLWWVRNTVLAMFALKLWHITLVIENTFRLF